MNKLTLVLLMMSSMAYAGSYSTNYSLYKPAKGDTDYIAPFATGMDNIDTAVKTNADGIGELRVSTGAIQTKLNEVIVSTGTLVKKSGDTMTGQLTTSSSMTAQGGFVGPLTGAASLNVLKAGDTMTGALNMSGSMIIGVSTITTTGENIVISPYSPSGNYSFAISIGSNAFSNYDYGIGVGRNAHSNYNHGVGVGYNAHSNYNHGVGVGDFANSNTTYGVGVGYNASGNYSHGVGLGDNASGNTTYGVGVGYNANGNINYAVGIGAYSENNGTYGSTLGAYSYAASSSTALGSYAKANAKESIAIGAGTVNNSTGTANFGVYAITTSNKVTISTATTSTDSLCFVGAVAALPTTGYSRGCLLYLNSDPTKLYISTETVVGTYSWLAK